MKRLWVLACCFSMVTAQSTQELLKRIEALEEAQHTRITAGGRVQMDMDMATPQGSYTPGGLVLFKEGEEAQLSMNVRDSRLWIKSISESDIGYIRSVAEVYFFGEKGNEINTNAHGLALRYLYATSNGFTVGQASSLFSTRYASDTLLKPINLTVVRQPMLAYTITLNTTTLFDMALEQPESYLNDTGGNKLSVNDDRFADMTLRLRSDIPYLEYAIAAMVRQIRYDAISIEGVDYEESADAWAWGVNVSGKLKLFTLDNLYINMQCGNGIGRYFTLNAYTDATLMPDGGLKLHRLYGGSVGYEHWFSSVWQSNLVWVGTYFDAPDVLAQSDLEKRVDSWQANVIYSPIKKGRVGIEYAWAKRTLLNGEKGETNWVRLQFRYDF